jgi:poly(3-hydroxybutyrate) depolymerase
MDGKIAMTRHEPARPNALATLSVPFLWPMATAAKLSAQGLELYARNLKFAAEEQKIHHQLIPKLATANRLALDLRTMVLRDYSTKNATGVPTIVDAPYAGHTAMIADYHKGQSLIETLLANGLDHVFLTDWKTATDDMKDLEIDQYLAELNVCVDDLGRRVNLVGLCQGGWLSAMYAARFPEKVASLVLAGSPIDTAAGDGPIKRMALAYSTSFYEELVALGGGLMRGSIMLQGWKGMHPERHYFQDQVDLYMHIDDSAYLAMTETFKSWYENPIDLPGRFYLQAIVQLFKENRLAKGMFVGLGRLLSLKTITCPAYLLAGEDDDITPKEQVFAAEELLGTPRKQITKALVPGGHIGLFMGNRTLKTNWPAIARWIAAVP